MASQNRRQRWLIAAVIIFCLPVVLEVYTRWPASFTVPDALVGADTRHLVIVFHGSDGKDNAAIAALESGLRDQLAGTDTEIVRYIWSPWSDNRLRASVNGVHAGQQLARQLANTNIQDLHLIGHSAGAWPVDALCGQLRQLANRKIRIRMTFLDPIGIRGFFNIDWGSQNFGECADFAEAIINTDDNVPGTNQPLQNAFNIDVTGLAHQGNGHEWPVLYFTDTMSGASVSMESTHFEMPRGAVARDVSESR